MFTGIIEEIGLVKQIKRKDAFVQLSIQCKKILQDIKIGDSIAVNGICLTVTNFGIDWFVADVMPETMRKTGLGELDITEKVNLERALRLSDRLGGHIVTGHIDGTGVITERAVEANAIWLTIKSSNAILRYIVMKGSVTLDGTSLTIAHVDEKSFKVSLIPLTASDTTLGAKKVGDRVNIEYDIIGKYVEKLLAPHTKESKEQKDLSMEFLKENGFL